MIALRLFLVGLVKLACIGGFVWLALHDHAACAWPLALLCWFTAFPSTTSEAPKRAPTSTPATSAIAKQAA